MTMDESSVDRRIRESFAKQGLMQTLGASLVHVSPGRVEIALVPRPEIAQQHGFVHAGAVSAIADSGSVVVPSPATSPAGSGTVVSCSSTHAARPRERMRSTTAGVAPNVRRRAACSAGSVVFGSAAVAGCRVLRLGSGTGVSTDGARA